MAQTNQEKKLILHFDQHNTIQVACHLPGRNVTVEEGLNNFLTAACWGKEVDNEWQWLIDEPQIDKPVNEPDAVTYFKYLEKKIVKSPEDRAELKKETCQFVYKEPGCKFRKYFNIYLKSLIYDKSFDFENLPCNTIPAGDPNNMFLYHLILPEFFDMILKLQNMNRSFTIILRTMGIDSQNFLDNVKPIVEGKHRDFKDLKPIKINPNIGLIKRYENNKIELEMDGQVYRSEEEIYEKLSSLEGINAIRDDFAYWQSHNYKCYSAKPLWINLNDTRNHHILFDDNIRLDEIDCIVNLRLKLNQNNSNFLNLNFDSYKYFHKNSIIQPNLLHLLNPELKLKNSKTNNYYLDHIIQAEKEHDLLLSKKNNFLIEMSLNDSFKGTFKLIKKENGMTKKIKDLNADEGLDADSKKKNLVTKICQIY